MGAKDDFRMITSTDPKYDVKHLIGRYTRQSKIERRISNGEMATD